MDEEYPQIKVVKLDGRKDWWCCNGMKLQLTRAIRKTASSTLSAASQICYRTITNASRRSHCGGSESCHLRDPPQAKNPAKQDSFLLIKWRSLRTLLRSDFRASTESERRRVRVNCNGIL